MKKILKKRFGGGWWKITALSAILGVFFLAGYWFTFYRTAASKTAVTFEGGQKLDVFIASEIPGTRLVLGGKKDRGFNNSCCGGAFTIGY